MFMCKVLLGSTSFWDHPEFLALKRGFDITIKGTSVVRVCYHPDAAGTLGLTIYTENDCLLLSSFDASLSL
jgi:hypothetical protein